MKNLKSTLVFVLSTTLLLTSCSTVKTSNSWSEMNTKDLWGKNILVVGKSENDEVRQRFEKDLTEQLMKKGICGTASHEVYPSLELIKEGTPERLEELGNSIHEKGYEIVILTVLRDVEEYATTVTEGTTYKIDTFPVYYGRRGYYRSFNRGFHTIYVEGGPYETVTTNNRKYILETLVYDLTKKDNNQLLMILTSTIDNPETLGGTSKDFSRAVSRELSK